MCWYKIRCKNLPAFFPSSRQYLFSDVECYLQTSRKQVHFSFSSIFVCIQSIEVISIYLVNHVKTQRLKTTNALLCSLFSNLGRPCLRSTWYLLGLGSPRWWIPAHVVSETSSSGNLFVWLPWAFSRHGLGVVELHMWWRLDSGGANSRSHWAILILFIPETGLVSSLPDSLGQKQVTGQSGSSRGDSIRCGHWAKVYWDHQGTWTSESISLKWEKTTFLFCFLLSNLTSLSIL